MKATSPVVEVERLTKRYGSRRGVEDVTFDVRRGEVFGFLGPNGAGKTTTLRVLMDLLRPTSGAVRVFGLDAREGRDEIHARTGYLPSDTGLPERERVRDTLEDLADLRGGVPTERVESLAKRLDLDLDRQVRALSHGNKRKVGIAQAFMHAPELLVLDEPTTGLDPLMQQTFNGLVREAKAEGRTVLLSSHILPEVEALCDRVAIIREGRIVAVAPMADLKSKLVRRVEARFRGPAPRDALDGVANVSDVRAEGDRLAFQAAGPLADAMRALAARPDFVDVATREPSLEDAFLGYYAEGRA